MTDADGALVQETRYLPFGGVRDDVGEITGTDFGYTGQRLLDAQVTTYSLGLMDYHARFYDPRIMQFQQPDTIIPNLYNPQSLNHYSYVYNNPINSTDPSGNAPICDEDGYCYDNVRGKYRAPVRYEITPHNQVWFSTISDPSYDPEVLEQNLEEITQVGEVIVSVLWEPADWTITAKYCLEGDCSPWLLLGLLPFIPSSVGKYGDDLFEVGMKLVGHHSIPRQILKMLPEDLAKFVRGKKGAPNIWHIPESIHKALHSGSGPGGLYNKVWRTAIEPLLQTGNITPETIFKLRDNIVQAFGISKWRP